MNGSRIQAADLARAVEHSFAAAGCDGETAACVARHLVDSNLCGHDSHGVIRVTRYLDFMKRGEVVSGARMSLAFESETVAVIDGNMGFGQVIGEQAMDLLAAKAKAAGLALAAVRNSGHLGRLGDWAEQLAAHGLVSLHFLNTTGKGMLAVPFGGSDRRLSLNPLAICFPVPGRHPVLLDMTTSVVAEGKLAVVRNKGELVPPGTIVDSRGQPSTDPNDFYAGGALLTMAGHKGYALNVVVDLLSGALSGGGCTRPGASVLVNTMTSIAIDPAPFTDETAYFAEIERYLAWVVGSPPSAPGGRVELPGDFEQRNRETRLRDGIPLDDGTRAELLAAATAAGASREALACLAG